jgi:hypothetical protein
MSLIRFIASYLGAPAPQTVAVGMATETDEAQAVAHFHPAPKLRIVRSNLVNI